MFDTSYPLPNLSPGHVDGCMTKAVYSDEDSPPVLIIESCVDGCPCQLIELEASNA